jgi:hypothetical protein
MVRGNWRRAYDAALRRADNGDVVGCGGNDGREAGSLHVYERCPMTVGRPIVFRGLVTYGCKQCNSIIMFS